MKYSKENILFYFCQIVLYCSFCPRFSQWWWWDEISNFLATRGFYHLVLQQGKPCNRPLSSSTLANTRETLMVAEQAVEQKTYYVCFMHSVYIKPNNELLSLSFKVNSSFSCFITLFLTLQLSIINTGDHSNLASPQSSG